ncbi:DUF2147 domain-containing protein [Stakelama marina]|uniref:DUF2147 domain-containing protein n=1 Tax=Stakelama marina TaxID=2826939 RepID=A0A8T4IH31_9SPHN|nr:DUF2147 domain-containing protein [Stakelama marina]MBR0553342.1 DUF2147 domain-containing protein [Stakelama marina]
MKALAVLAGCLLAVPAFAAPAPVTGRWITEDGKALVEIGRCGQSLCGKVAKILKVDPSKPTHDVHNPDPAKRNRPIEGLTILSGLTADGDEWKGQIYDPKSGKTYRSVLQRDGRTLTVKGCIGPFCKTQHWQPAT